MVTSGNGNNEYSIRKRYPKRLESWEILKQCEFCVFPNVKLQKRARTFQTQAIQKPKIELIQ